jgi:hypothetical protein
VSVLDLPNYKPFWKAATRALVAAFDAPGQTGPERVASILSVSRGTITKWSKDGYEEIMPGFVAMQLEFVLQRPVFARVFAELTGCRVVGLDDDGDRPRDASLMTSFFDTVTQLGALTATWSEAARDGVHTPIEKQIVREKIFETIDLLSEKARRLSVQEAGQ